MDKLSFAKFFAALVVAAAFMSVASLSFGADGKLELEIQAIESGFVRIVLLNNDNIVKPDKILGKTGVIAVKTKAYNPHNVLAVKLYGIDSHDGSMELLGPYINRDNTISLPVSFNYQESENPGYHMDVEVALITRKNDLLSTSTVIDLQQPGSPHAFQSVEIYQSVMARLKQIQLSTVQLDRLEQNLKASDQYDVCALALTADSRPGWSMNKQHCNPDENGLYGDSFVMQSCSQSSDQLFDNLIQAANEQCHINALAEQQVGSSVADELVDFYVANRLQYLQIFSAIATLDQVKQWYDQFLPDSSAAMKASLEKLLQPVAERKKEFNDFIHQLVASEDYSDLVVAELISAIITENVRERDLVRNICRQQSSELEPQLCFDFASDIALGLLKPFAAVDLDDLNGKVAAIRQKYQQSLSGKLPEDFVHASMMAIRHWTEFYAHENYGQPNCFNKSVFPLDFMVERNRIPNPDLLKQRDSEEYQYMVDSLVKTMEAAISQLRTSLRRYPGLSSSQLKPVSCTDMILLGPTFDRLLGMRTNVKPVSSK